MRKKFLKSIFGLILIPSLASCSTIPNEVTVKDDYNKEREILIKRKNISCSMTSESNEQPFECRAFGYYKDNNEVFSEKSRCPHITCDLYFCRDTNPVCDAAEAYELY